MEAIVSVRAHLQEAGILGLEPGDHDPVRIIRAAQLRLRRYRGEISAAGYSPTTEMRLIIAARDPLLRRAVVRLANHDHRDGGG